MEWLRSLIGSAVYKEEEEAPNNEQSTAPSDVAAMVGEDVSTDQQPIAQVGIVSMPEEELHSITESVPQPIAEPYPVDAITAIQLSYREEEEDGSMVVETETNGVDKDDSDDDSKPTTTPVITEAPREQIDINTHFPIECVGQISAVVEGTTVVQGIKDKKALDCGSVLCFEDKTPLGRISETFGPVQMPFYSIQSLAVGVDMTRVVAGTPVFSPPAMSSFLLVSQLYSKGSDASGKDDHEAAADDLEFSDDEEEAAHKMALRNARRTQAEQNEDDEMEEGLVSKEWDGDGESSLMRSTGRGGRGNVRGKGNRRGRGGRGRGRGWSADRNTDAQQRPSDPAPGIPPAGWVQQPYYPAQYQQLPPQGWSHPPQPHNPEYMSQYNTQQTIPTGIQEPQMPPSAHNFYPGYQQPISSFSYPQQHYYQQPQQLVSPYYHTPQPMEASQQPLSAPSDSSTHT